LSLSTRFAIRMQDRDSDPDPQGGQRVSRYAEQTDVPSERSRAEIERTLARYGAAQFMYGWDRTTAIIAFELADRRIRFRLTLPDRDDAAFTRTPARGTKRSDAHAERAYEQAVRQRWRALALVIKAKLEAVESGITEFEDEFLAHIVLPDGATVGEHLLAQVADAYRTGRMPPLLPGPSTKADPTP
jgi:hypothetical protein